ncbi:MAG: hypothetical protein Q8R30_01760 [bacterium]|nr:hypothetical protein [bacterium]MDZ4285355.1 hypothetical protein [Candidatus Sungbacteria bacterium]
MKHIKRILSGYKGNQLITIVLIVLVLIALVLGYFIYVQLSPLGVAQKDYSTESGSSPNQNLTADEQAVLNPPAKGSTEDAFKQHAELVQRLAKDADYLDITGCAANPVVFRVKDKTKIAVKNSDQGKHSLIFDSAHIYEIPPHATTQIAIDFSHGSGIYGYGCDGVPHAVGMFLVTN